ncbi:3-deoxy-7-phosphoheptulonate synthase [Nonomuraea antimicrobica]
MSSLVETRDWVHFRRLPARQQPDWPDRDELHAVLRSLPQDDLVTRDSVDELWIALAGLESGGLVLQLGDCVEDIDEDVGAVTRQKLGFLDEARSRLRHRTGREVIAVGRLAGQYAKPRSSDHEIVDGVALPSFRGPIVNSPTRAWTPASRRRTASHGPTPPPSGPTK